MQVKLALPKGRLLQPTSGLLQQSGLELSGYDEQSRSYRPQCSNSPDLVLKIFNEKDVPIQVAVGNYDLGICGHDWVEELLTKYPSSAVVKVKDLGYGTRELCMVANKASQLASINDLTHRAEREYDLFPLTTILHSSACLIAHRPSWESKNMSSLLQGLYAAEGVSQIATEPASTPRSGTATSFPRRPQPNSDSVWLALPDGHQQAPALQFLQRAGLNLGQHPQEPRRPSINLEGVFAKTIRPQDMPLQVANGNFDLAITGEDWLYDHLYRFPSSPLKKILNLGFGKVRIVAVVSKNLPFDTTQDLRSPFRRHSFTTLRIASEYVNIADKYARDNHLSPYRLLPTWGATEAFLPEDADVLIENTQTGRTIAQHNLKIVDTLFESSACLISNVDSSSGSELKTKKIGDIVDLLHKTAS
jgi:ATP phosphoribosyltransferase